MLDDFEAQANLHGKKFNRPPRPLKIKKEDREHFDKQAKELQKRLRRRYYEKQFGDKLKNGE